jgi:hypothetical protein
METVNATRKPGIAAMSLGLPMLFFGTLMFLFGCYDVMEWQAEQVSLVVCGILLVLAGLATLGSAIWMLGSLGRSKKALQIGGGAMISSGAVLATAAATHIMPCSGPA